MKDFVFRAPSVLPPKQTPEERAMIEKWLSDPRNYQRMMAAKKAQDESPVKIEKKPVSPQRLASLRKAGRNGGAAKSAQEKREEARRQAT